MLQEKNAIVIMMLVFVLLSFSVLFHATLQYEHQMWDEVCSCVYMCVCA
jgi:hypothetical protein